MRAWLGVWGVCAASGCNAILGLGDTVAIDAAIPPDALMIPAKLTYEVALTTPDRRQDPTILSLPIEPAPVVRIGLLDQPLVETSYLDSGAFGYPQELIGLPWRVEYKPPGDTVHEVQWSPAAGEGHLVVPHFGRRARTAAAPGTGYQIMTSNNTEWHGVNDGTTPNRTTIYSTGYWTRTALTGGTTTSINLDLSTVAPLSGAPGVPDGSLGDVVVAIDRAVAGECFVAGASAAFIATPLSPGTLVPVTATAGGGAVALEIHYPQGRATLLARLAAALGSRHHAGVGNDVAAATFGRAAHTDMPGFTHEFNGIPAPLFVPLVECPVPGIAGQLSTPPFSNPGVLKDLPGALFAYVANQRQAGSTRLLSSLASLTTATVGMTATPSFGVPLATTVLLGAHDLASDTDAQVIDATPLTLTFQVESTPGADLVLDYFEVVLTRIDGATPVPVRVYVGNDVAKRSIRFDPAVMEPGVLYGFAIRTYRGRPDARRGDFRRIAYPQAMGTVYTRSFSRLP